MAQKTKNTTTGVLSGKLYKWTNYIKGYRSRWFIVMDGVLSYYRDADNAVDGNCRGLMRLSSVSIRTHDTKSFVVASGHTTYYLKANSSEARNLWIRAITMEAEKVKPLATEDKKLIFSNLHNMETKFEQMKTYSNLIQLNISAFQKDIQGLTKMSLPQKASQKLHIISDSAEQLVDISKKMGSTSDELASLSQFIHNDIQQLLDRANSNARQLEEMLEQLSQQHLNLERKMEQMSTLEANTSVDSQSEDEYFDALSEETTHVVIKLPVSKKEKEEQEEEGEETTITPEIIRARSDSTDSDDDDSRSDCVACVFRRKPQQSSDVIEPNNTDMQIDKPVTTQIDKLVTTQIDKPVTTQIDKRKSSFGGMRLSRIIRKESVAPKFDRRTMIPPPPSASASLWAVLKSFIGNDLSKISLPVCFNEPLTFLQRLTEDYQYSGCLDKAASCESSLEQMTHVAAFVIASYSSMAKRVLKPFNPILGETYECDRRDDYGWKSIAEQVSHHPPCIAMHCETQEWVHWQEFIMYTKFKGHYIQVTPVGYAHLRFQKSGNHYMWQKVESTVHNIILGNLWVDHHGETTITNNKTQDTCQLVFYQASTFSRDNYRKVTGVVSDVKTVEHYILQGTWDDQMESCKVLSKSQTSRGKPTFKTDAPVVIWKMHQTPPDASYNFSELGIQLNQPEANIAPTDSRYRPDLRLLEEGDMFEADKIKMLLEEKQRSSQRRRQSRAVEKGVEPETADTLWYDAKWFRRETDPLTGSTMHRFTNEYWNCKKRRDWSRCPNIFL